VRNAAVRENWKARVDADTAARRTLELVIAAVIK
jgi:hypothetical protein